ncbi:5005_t:CDS:2 [Ambispora gerdemannii]|uniref:5005_t:CDS:1 n=1 Tax=Ambispora gerdemannii TaxID=144530 RepID=A0A9N9D0J9_9GLOM|nr:5005_t:CDS:2 [Ambispora gerdemannii]
MENTKALIDDANINRIGIEIDISLKLSIAKRNNGGKIAKINMIDTGRIMSTADLNINVNKIIISMDQVKADATMVTLSMPNIAYNMDGIKMKGMRIEKNKVT